MTTQGPISNLVLSMFGDSCGYRSLCLPEGKAYDDLMDQYLCELSSDDLPTSTLRDLLRSWHRAIKAVSAFLGEPYTLSEEEAIEFLGHLAVLTIEKEDEDAAINS